jgi:SAM-dependent methyltransferase
LTFEVADGEELPFADGSFDAVCSNFVIPHLGRHDRVVGELVRVLGVDGRLAMTTWDTPDRMRLLGVFLDAFADAKAETPAEIPLGPPFFQFADDHKFADLLVKNGLVDVAVDTISFVHQVESAGQLWAGILDGTVRTSAFILGQSRPTQQRIRSAFDRLVQEYAQGDGLALPVSVKLASGRRAS